MKCVNVAGGHCIRRSVVSTDQPSRPTAGRTHLCPVMVEIDLEVPNRPARTSVTDLVDLVGQNALSRQLTSLGPVMVETILIRRLSNHNKLGSDCQVEDNKLEDCIARVPLSVPSAELSRDKSAN